MDIDLKEFKNKTLKDGLSKSTRTSSLSSCVLIFLYLFTLSLINSVSKLSYLIAVFLFSVQIFRYFLCRDQKLKAVNWLNQYTFATVANSLGWAALITSVMLQNIEKLQVINLSLTVVAGLISAGAYSLSISKRDFFIFQASMITVVIIGFYISSDDIYFHISGSLLAALFFAYLLIQRKYQENTWLKNIMHSYELQNIIDTFPGGISVLRDGKYILINDYIKKYLLQANESLNLQQLKLGDLKKDENEFVKKIKIFSDSKDKRTHFETELIFNQEKRAHFVVAENIFKLTSVDTVVASIDIQNLKKSENENRLNRLKLEHSSKMASLGEMSSGLAHEINNPLAIIIGRTQILQKQVTSNQIDAESLKKGLDIIEKTTTRIAKIIKGLKTFARNADHDDFSKARVKDIIDETLSFCEERFKNNGVKLNCRLINIDDIMIECRPAQISQVLLNVLNNAFDAIKNLEEKWINLDVEKSDQKIIIKVTDSGPGIAKEIQSKLMQPFFTTKNVGDGTGLGLSISKGIIEAQNGKIYFNFDHPTNTQLVIEILEIQPILS
jgi:nitrogen-specific signal transduction histidine kinase